MASDSETTEALNAAAITLAKKAADASHAPTAIQYAYGAAALALAAQGAPFAGSYSAS
jgi:hypothetical protein